jgi:hypothetical protein
MAWFQYSDQTRRRYRKGIWLRVRSLPDDLIAKIAERNVKNERVLWIVVKELQPKNQVVLEVWCEQKPFTVNGFDEVYTVFYLLVDENPDWICESDLGRGLV